MTVVSGTHHGGLWRGAWPAEPSDPQPVVEGSYAGWLGPHSRAQTCVEQHKRRRAPQPATRQLTNLLVHPGHTASDLEIGEPWPVGEHAAMRAVLRASGAGKVDSL